MEHFLKEPAKTHTKETTMELQEVLEKYAEMTKEQHRVLEVTDIWAARFFTQLDDIPRLVSRNGELSNCMKIDVQPGIEDLSPKDPKWARSLRIEHWVIDFIYVRQARYSDMGVPTGKEARLCTRLVGLQHDTTRTARPIVSPRLVVNLFEDNWVAQIDPFQQPVLEKSGMTDDFEDLLPCFLEIVLFGNKYHPDLSWPAPESMKPMQAEGPNQEPEVEMKRLVEESLYGTTRADLLRRSKTSEMLHLLSCLG
jgi:hypothetical protein